MTDDRPLHLILNCHGYYGFGSGYALSRYGPSNDGGPLYCNKCPIRSKCWQAHRGRVAVIFPALTRIAEDIAKTHRGPAYIMEWSRRVRDKGDACSEPYIAVMGANLRDGAAIACNQAPERRGKAGLTWPLEPIPELEE